MVRPELDIESKGSRLRLSGEIDMSTADLLAPAIAGATAHGSPVLLEISAVTFLDSTGIRELLAALRAMLEGCILLHGVRGGVARVLEVTGVAGIPRMHVIPCEEFALVETH